MASTPPDADATSPNKLGRPLVAMAAVGSEMVGFSLVGIMIDYATGMLNTIPWATLILAPLGVMIGLIHLITLAGKPRKPA